MSHVLVFHRKTRRPGCVLIQAVFGGDTHFLKKHIPTDMWEVHHVGEMVPMTVTEENVGEVLEVLKELQDRDWPEIF